jgi:hypothetical protein
LLRNRRICHSGGTEKIIAHGIERSRNFFIDFISAGVHFREPESFLIFPAKEAIA